MVLRRYQDFLSTFVNIESAAEQAIMAVDSDDPNWLALSARDRTLATREEDSVQRLENEAMWFLNDDLRELPIFNLRQFANALIYTEANFDAQRMTEMLEASARVARALGQDLEIPESWPKSYSLADFAMKTGLNDLAEMLDAVRANYPSRRLREAVQRI